MARKKARKKKPRQWFEDLKIGLPARMKLSVPYNHKPDLLDALEGVADRVAWLYLPFHPDVSLSARAFKGAKTARGYTAELKRVAKRLEPLGIGMNLVANAPHWAINTKAVVSAATGLRENISGLRVTFADLVAAKDFSLQCDRLEIAVSCLADVQRPVQAMWWREQAYATHLTVSREINRRPGAIEALGKFGMTLGVVAFDDCVPGCQHKLRHFPAADRFEAGCDPENVLVRVMRPWLLAQKEILPGHLKRLPPAVIEIKVSGRDASTDEIIRRVGLYLEAKSFSHPNGYYAEPASAWEYLARCDRNCPACDWCNDHIKRLEVSSERLPRATADRPPEWSATFRTKAGARVRLWIEPARTDRIPPRVVSGRGIYYGIMGDVNPALAEELIRLVAGLMESWKGKFNPVRLQAALESGELPGSLELVDEDEQDER
jgi:hypothetical protein